jgi:hypothetical protein
MLEKKLQQAIFDDRNLASCQHCERSASFRLPVKFCGACSPRRRICLLNLFAKLLFALRGR